MYVDEVSDGLPSRNAAMCHALLSESICDGVPVSPMNCGEKRAAYRCTWAGVSRSGSTLTKTNRTAEAFAPEFFTGLRVKAGEDAAIGDHVEFVADQCQRRFARDVLFVTPCNVCLRDVAFAAETNRHEIAVHETGAAIN